MSIIILPINDGVVGSPAPVSPLTSIFADSAAFGASLVETLASVWTLFSGSPVMVIGRQIPLRSNDTGDNNMEIDMIVMDTAARLYIVENQDLAERRPVSKAYSKCAWVRHHYNVEDVVGQLSEHLGVTPHEALATLAGFCNVETASFELSRSKPAMVVVATDVTPGEGVTTAALVEDGNDVTIIKPALTVVDGVQMLVLQRCYPSEGLDAITDVQPQVAHVVVEAPIEPPAPDTSETEDQVAAIALTILAMVALGGDDNKLAKTSLRRDVKGGKLLDEALADLEAREFLMYSKEENTQTGRNHTVVELTEAGHAFLAESRSNNNKVPDGLMSIGVAPELKAWVPQTIVPRA
jgi:hypothetical protein